MDEVAELVYGLLGLGGRLVDKGGYVLAFRRLVLGGRQGHDDGGESLLRPVVEVALDPAARGVERGGDAGAGCGDAGQLSAEPFAFVVAEEVAGDVTLAFCQERYRVQADDKGEEFPR